MRVSLDWLKEFVDIKGGLDKIRFKLTMTGLEVTSVLDIEGDSVMDIEITPNRPDCLSVLGVARELSAAMDRSLKIPDSIRKNYMKKGPGRGTAKIEIADKKGCKRYVGCILKNVKVGPSPRWLIARLNAMGVRSVNNIVDITNYVLFETGQPLHAFDLDKLAGKRIIVRRAKKGESLVTIDGIKRELDPTMLIIADAEKPVAIAGIMGGKDTEISEGTKNILLESAYFDPMTVRKSQRNLALASESSYRFERGVDMAMILAASARTQEMIKDIDGGRLSGKITDIGPKPEKEREIALCLEEIPRVLGISISPKEAMDCFNRLNLKPLKNTKDKIVVKVPSYRQDLYNDVDLIEELVRLYGYDRVPVKDPVFAAQKTYEEERKEFSFLKKNAKDILYSLGLNETVSYTLTSRFAIESLGVPFDNLIRLRNPLSSNQEFMRPTLISEMLEVASWNLNRNNTLLQLFELNKIYVKSKDGLGAEEKYSLCICICGTTEGNWKEKSRAVDFFDLKGVVELFLKSLGIKEFSIENAETFIFREGMSASIKIGGETVGSMGEVRSDVARKFDVKQKVYLAELAFEGLLKYVNLQKRFEPLPKYPSVSRDISLVVADSVSAGAINDAIREEGGELIKSIEIFDLYKGQQIEEDKKSLAYTIKYRSDEKTLKDEDIAEVHKKIQERLVKKLGAQIR